MITIILTCRNRSIHIVKNCLQSLRIQSDRSFDVVLVNYGSLPDYTEALNALCQEFDFLNLLHCKTQHQLWCKSHAINIALKTCKTPYVFIGDIDMIYHPNFIEKLHVLKKENKSIYFQVGFLSESESKESKAFFDYQVSFKSAKEATGMTLYPTKALMAINGYDEFYNGWGSEDTDTHVRFRNASYNVDFYDIELLILHQWHPKSYRQKNSTAPFHSKLEQINQKYLEYTEQSGKVHANSKYDWGYYNEQDYQILENHDMEFTATNELADIKGLINNVLLNLEGRVVSILINQHKDYKTLYHLSKRLLGKKVKTFMSMQQVNDLILESIVLNCPSSAYTYVFNRHSQEIKLVIKL
ncbi:glycosyltransferase family 2 protein [Algibacter mikhailovii]|uniref:glycosyltransferase family 2 protein n=1 Tax=Algibacter mikhailovii TaxID=425498 RepID=UPI00249525A0|nr:galactosyltransferase-related protein [Algibacter mikhailovii]